MPHLHLPLLLVTLVVLVIIQIGWTPADACSCMPMHPQTMFCEHSDWVIKAKVKTNRLVNRNYTYTDSSGNLHTNQMPERLMGVKISKVFKDAPGVSQGGFVRLYSSAMGSMCGRSLTVNLTYLIQGRRDDDGRLTFDLCDNPTEWIKLPPLLRRGYGYLYKKNCECKIPSHCNGRDCGCYMDPSWSWAQKQCYRDNAVCVMDSSANEIVGFNSESSSCKWSRRSLFYRCMAAANQDKPFDWEP